MTTAATATAPAPAPPLAGRPSLLSRALLLRFVSMFGSSISFYLPLAVMPLYAAASGSHATAGLANAALLVATVAGELVTPRLVARVGYRWALAGGLVLLGAPALLLFVSSAFSLLLAVSVVRGLGFAVTTVAGGALTASLVPADRRGEGLAVVGLVAGVPALTALPFGVWAAGHWGFGVVFVVTAVAPLTALVTLPCLPVRDRPAGGPSSAADAAERHGVLRGLRTGALMRPATVFAASAGAAGVLVTYLPLAVGHAAAWLAPIALFVQPAAATGARWVAGRFGDRYGQTRLLVPGVALTAVGMAALAGTSVPALVVSGAALVGLGFGILQNGTLSLMYARVPATGYSTVSALWNAAYDLGMAAGAAVVGLLVWFTGFPPAFLLSAAALLPALVLAHREHVRSQVAAGRRRTGDRPDPRRPAAPPPGRRRGPRAAGPPARGRGRPGDRARPGSAR